MEDRHYLSEPRPISGLKLPTWEVDVMREGVDLPILTLKVDNQVLPPRKRKKKVVWKLPDNLDTTPKFGMEDKRRILELFKQKKKELKRQRKSQTATSGGGSGGSGSGSAGGSGSGDRSSSHEDSPPSQPKPKVVLKRMSSSALSVDSYMTAKEDEEEKVERPEPGEEKVEDNGNHHLSSSPPPPGFNMSGLSLEEQETTSVGVGGGSNNTNNTTRRNPSPAPPEQLPPERPTMQPLQERSHSFAGSRGPPMGRPTTAATATMSSPPLPTSSQPPAAPPGMLHHPASRRASTSSIPPPGIANNNNNANPFQNLMARHFIVADPNALGHVVMETYYLLLRNGMITDLAQYYLPHAQKSLTVGGAHALCTHVDQRLQQLESLSNMVLQVKGVLQHPRFDPNENIYVMITGTSVRPHTLPFCHSLTLKQVGPQSFQIQNDALAFLTTEG